MKPPAMSRSCYGWKPIAGSVGQASGARRVPPAVRARFPLARPRSPPTEAKGCLSVCLSVGAGLGSGPWAEAGGPG